MSTPRFVHLHVHTEFSMVDSTIRVPAKPDQADPKKAKQANLLSRSVEMRAPALAVTDLNNMFALVKFYKAAEGVGIKPIAGADVLIAEEGHDPWRMTLLCRDREGYLSLSRLLSRAWLEGHRPEGGVAIHPQWLKDGCHNLFALAGRQSLAGRLALDGKHELAEQQLADWQRVFGDGLHLELTETAVIGDEMLAASLLEKLHRTGVKVWLDDFGTGFSGLSHLRQVPVDGVKIDKSFVADLQRDPDDLALTTAIIAMAHALGITVVAEGVEQQAQFELLSQRGCDLVQGYWFARPLDSEDLVRLVDAAPSPS